MYEAMNEVYKILTPIAEAHRDFKKLANIHRYTVNETVLFRCQFKRTLSSSANFSMRLRALNNNTASECLELTFALDFMVLSLAT